MTQFDPVMVLEVFPKIINTFVVLISDEGISASHRSFNGILRIHRLFLALAQQYPGIKNEALRRLKSFVACEKNRIKSSCRSLGNLLPLLMIVDQKEFSWFQIGSAYVGESFDRSVLWVCKKFPKLEKTHDMFGNVETESHSNERVTLTKEAMTVSNRLTMFHVFFLYTYCKGTTNNRASLYDNYLGKAEEECEQGGLVDKMPRNVPQLSFSRFRNEIAYILSINTWQQFFKFVRIRCPATKVHMAHTLRQHVRNSRRKGYHKAGMDFSRVHQSGTSQILSKGQTYSVNSDLQRVIFTDVWGYTGPTKYLDATCILYDGNRRVHTVDYNNTHAENGAIQHSGDVMRENGGTHTINLNLQMLDPKITACVFVISSWADATLSDILSPSISFTDADAEPGAAPLCQYDLDKHDKISHLTSVVMCKLYRSRNGGWHVVAIGDAHRGAADNYGPIYAAVEKLL
eukprot:CAMPEP_0172522098 /NCGR_PEP_ID=MMETSP1066-20121228/292940_1 /TAXON_ID=671091 /ORGANISM="Coscinodiscus wailesii, Strain CCMP2513" /LENGTH=458 /DNA_ID=CAMNT_0013305069 /DNA_START=878 /DNA_END=2254 /DNA_ORIENTATION=-